MASSVWWSFNISSRIICSKILIVGNAQEYSLYLVVVERMFIIGIGKSHQLYPVNYYGYNVIIQSSTDFMNWKASVIRQKSESQNGCFKKTKHAKFFKKRTFLTPWYAHESFEILPFTLLPSKAHVLELSKLLH